MKLHVHDTVKVVAGKNRGQTGEVTKILRKENKVIVKGMNLYRRHLKKQGDQPGGIVEIERPLPASNVQLVCPSCGKVTRIRYEGSKTSKQRVCKKCGNPIKKE